MTLREYVPATARSVWACQIPDPADSTAYGPFVGDLIASGRVRSVEIAEPRDATEKSPALKGGVRFKPAAGGNKSFIRSPGDWLVWTETEGLRGCSADAFAGLGLVLAGPTYTGHPEPVETPEEIVARIGVEELNGAGVPDDGPLDDAAPTGRGRSRTVAAS